MPRKKEMQPLISIVIANYNYGRFLETAIQSVLRQCDNEMRLPSGDELELIIVDGGSTDNSVEIIQKYENKLAWWCSEKDRGQSHAINKGFARAKGFFLTWLNADDIMISGGLKAIVSEIKGHPQGQWFIGSTIWLDKSLNVIRCFCAHRFCVLRARHGSLSAGGPSSFFRKTLLDQVGEVDERFHYCMDTELWSRFYFDAGQHYRRTKKYVWGFRIHADSKVSGLDVLPESEAAYLRRQEQHREDREIEKIRHKRSRVVRVVNLLTISPVDALWAWIETFRRRGHRLMSDGGI